MKSMVAADVAVDAVDASVEAAAGMVEVEDEAITEAVEAAGAGVDAEPPARMTTVLFPNRLTV